LKAAAVNNRIKLLNGADHKKVTKLPSKFTHGPSGLRAGLDRGSSDRQTDELRAGGCAAIYQEHGSGASRARPSSLWEDVVRVLNMETGVIWTVERLRRAVRRTVRERLADPKLLEGSPRWRPEDRLMMLVAGIAMANPDMPLRAIDAAPVRAEAQRRMARKRLSCLARNGRSPGEESRAAPLRLRRSRR
jgi:hypothetical protein